MTLERAEEAALPDPRTRPFYLNGYGPRAATGVLMIHGFTGSPSEFTRLGSYLNELGFTVQAICLPGHGTTLREMERTRWEDWWAHALAAYEEMKRQGYSRIVTVGHSMGGLLALKLATERTLSGVVSLSAPIYVPLRDSVTQLARSYLRQRSQPEACREKAVMPTERAFYYERPPFPCLLSLWRLLCTVKDKLPRVDAPALISQGGLDRVVLPKSAEYLYRHIGSHRKALRVYPEGTHSILFDPGRDRVFQDIRAFLRIVGMSHSR